MWAGATTCAAIVALAHCVTVTEAFSPSSPAIALSGRSTAPRSCLSSLRAMSDDETAERMIKSLQTHIKGVVGSEGFSTRTEHKFMGSKRLGKLVNKLSGGGVDDKELERNNKIAFDHLINEMKGLEGSESFRSQETHDFVSEAEKIAQEFFEKDDSSIVEKIAMDEARILGSKRMYRLVKKATETLARPVPRKNHPGETIQQNFHTK
jgi:hypothetical protein